jgi:hypothetical protein
MVKRMLELMLQCHPPGRLWIIGQTRSQAAQDVVNLSLRALMLFGPLLCH